MSATRRRTPPIDLGKIENDLRVWMLDTIEKMYEYSDLFGMLADAAAGGMSPAAVFYRQMDVVELRRIGGMFDEVACTLNVALPRIPSDEPYPPAVVAALEWARGQKPAVKEKPARRPVVKVAKQTV